jgi:hypothetical protein
LKIDMDSIFHSIVLVGICGTATLNNYIGKSKSQLSD